MSSGFLARSISHSIQRISRIYDIHIQSNQPYNTNGQVFEEEDWEKRTKEMDALLEKPAFTPADMKAYWDALEHINTTGIDDRLLLLEKLLVLMARLSEFEPSKMIASKVQEFVIQTLYDDLPHPPSSYLAALDSKETVATAPKGIKYAFRSADGSNYNPLFPSLGKAGSPYARTVPALHRIPNHALPDPGLVFDTLLKRDKFEPHPGGVSSLFFAFADLIIHCIFDTNHADWTVNNTSSYLDLSILYGNSEADQKKVRRLDGSGKLWDDVFADPRLLLMPPATCALLVLFSRNHNYIAQKLLDINENGNLVYPYPTDHPTCGKQDDEIFHRARLVNCGYFIKIILGDYVGSILGLVRDQNAWRLDPMLSSREANHQVSPRGEGNVCSVEFNLLYRWHSTLSEKDAEWTTTLFSKLFEGKDSSKVTISDFQTAAHKALIPNPDVKKREFGNIKRQEDGRFKDSDLAKIIHDATSWQASAFRARGIPEAMRIIEVMGIEQARSWGTCSLNEFRKFLGLKPYESFKEWNTNEDIYTAATALYKDINNLELHVGLQAEEAKKPGPGAGLCPGYTISRAILSDAVALVRGDRYLTTDFTPNNLTAWGYSDCQYDPKDGSFGGMLTKLLFRHLPDYFPAGSAYAHFPFLVPSFMKANLAKTAGPELVNKYTWTRPAPPAPFFSATSYAEVTDIVENPAVFRSAYSRRLYEIVSSEKSAKGVDDSKLQRLIAGRRSIEQILSPELSRSAWPKYFKEEIKSLVVAKSTTHVGVPDLTYVDIVADVINLLPIHWISERVIGLPLKTNTNEHGTWTQRHAYQAFADVGDYIFLNFDPVYDWRLRESAHKTFKKVYHGARSHLEALPTGSIIEGAEDRVMHGNIDGKDYKTFLKQAKEQNPSATPEEIATYIFAAVVPTAAQFSQAISHVIDFYLDEARKAEREEIVKLAVTWYDSASSQKTMGYVREALRINPPVRAFYRTSVQDTQLGSARVPAGARVFASVADANLDTSVFGPTPSTLSYTRDTGKAGIQGVGEDGLFAAAFFESVVPVIVGEILSLKNIQRAPGLSGHFAKFDEEWHGTKLQVYVDAAGKHTPFPDSLVVQYNV